MFDENKHPRDSCGKFTDKGRTEADKKAEAERIYNSDGFGGTHIATPAERKRLEELGIKEERMKEYEHLTDILGEEFKGYKGQSAIDKLLKEKRGHIKGAFHRDDIGDIDLLWGNDYLGLQHIILQREKEKDGHSLEVLNHLVTAIEKGNFNKRNERGNFEFVNNENNVKYVTIIAPEYHGNKITFVLTAFRRGKK